jgi:hypothetical protein
MRTLLHVCLVGPGSFALSTTGDHDGLADTAAGLRRRDPTESELVVLKSARPRSLMGGAQAVPQADAHSHRGEQLRAASEPRSFWGLLAPDKANHLAGANPDHACLADSCPWTT